MCAECGLSQQERKSPQIKRPFLVIHMFQSPQFQFILGTVAIAGVAVGTARTASAVGDPIGPSTRRLLPALVNVPAQPNESWAMDFVSDALYRDRRFRTLHVLDEGVREGLRSTGIPALPAARVVRTPGAGRRMAWISQSAASG